MKISKFNHEGYHDPTPYLAFLNIPDPAKEAKKEQHAAATGSSRYSPHRLHLFALRGRRQGQCHERPALLPLRG